MHTVRTETGGMRFFDLNAMIGPCFAPRLERQPEAGHLLADMDLYGIERSLVFHGLAYEYHGMTGNRELVEVVAREPRLQAAWVVGLHHAGQYPPPEDLVAELVESGAVAARFFWGGVLSETSLPDYDAHEALWGELERRRVPTIVCFDEAATVTGSQIAELSGMLKGFPELPVILSFARMGKDFALLYEKLDRYPNLHVETTGLMIDHMVEDLVQRAGAGRLLFGSNFPWYKAGQTRIALAYAQLSEDEKAMIAGENLERLIGGVVR